MKSVTSTYFFSPMLILFVFFAHYAAGDLKKEEGYNDGIIRPKIRDNCRTMQRIIDFQAGIKHLHPPGGAKLIQSLHFTVHFDTTGYRAVTRAYAESTSKYAEFCWAKQIDTLGWAPLPPDGLSGGDSTYDIYIDTGGAYCQPEDDYPNPYPDGVTSWINIPPDISFDGIKVDVAHEFNHASQLRYSDSEGRWWMENCACWMEDVCYDDVNSYLGWLNWAGSPLDSTMYSIQAWQYGGVIWAMFLHEYYDINCPQKCWWYMGIISGENTLSGINWTLYNYYYSSNLTLALGHYAIWRYFTGDIANALYFSESPLFRTSTLLRTWNTYPVDSSQERANPSGPGGCNFIRFTNFGDNRITIYFDGENGYEWAAYVLGTGGEPPYEYKIPIEPNQDTGRITIPGWEFSEVVLIPVVTQWLNSANNLLFNYTATLTPHLDRPADGVLAEEKNILSPMLQIQHNPFKSQTTISYFLPINSNNASLEIFDSSGRLVTSHKLINKNNYYIWSGKDAKGQKVTSGIYFCRLTVDKQTIQKKLILTR